MTTLDDSGIAVASAEQEAMAKKKPEPERPKTLFAVKGTSAWFDWLKRYAIFSGFSVATIIDIALKNQAKRDGFDEPMPKRMSKPSPE